MSMLFKLLHVPSLIMHVDLLLTLFGFEGIHVWNRKFIKTVEDLVLNRFWSFDTFFNGQFYIC